jgi:hypothetical protein
MVMVLHALKAPLTIYRRYFTASTLERLLDCRRQEWDMQIAETPSIVVSRA